ncbi:MAG: isopenicillin N synthase family oxygenase [Gammaproteobacteria bacterium]|nr:isopenicillin N synthase family oxygenase [Gammaproteobacteria bacterium]
MSSDLVPILDISELDTRPRHFIECFGRAYGQWGFAGIVGHGIDRDIIAKAMEAAKWFFDQPIKIKNSLKHPQSWSRGYVPQGVEKAKDSVHADLKEFYHLGRDSAVGHEENIWPTNEEFKSAYIDLHYALDQLSLKVLRATALFLELPEHYFQASVLSGEALLRILHYPPIKDQSSPNVRAAAHEDINLITLLVGSEQEGLEVLTLNQRWVPINMIEGTIICNVGDMLQRLSNGILRSTTHRVVNPRGERAYQSRYSMPFFVHPDPDMSLACLPQCCSKERPKQYADILAGDYHQQRLKEIGF